ncbi:MAG: hypothetical protein DRP82_01755 [Planctomycetota bacterium]|nr:MAG: hypothetical protein DRP82_01755 [Planctomycetota bacterium]
MLGRIVLGSGVLPRVIKSGQPLHVVPAFLTISELAYYASAAGFEKSKAGWMLGNLVSFAKTQKDRSSEGEDDIFAGGDFGEEAFQNAGFGYEVLLRSAERSDVAFGWVEPALSGWLVSLRESIAWIIGL